MHANWQARFLLELLGSVKVSGLQRLRANLSNPLICGVRPHLLEVNVLTSTADTSVVAFVEDEDV